MSASEPISALYSREILRHTAAMSRTGRLAAPDGSADAVSRLCGSKVTVDLTLDEGVVTDYAHEVEACALGQCAASIMARQIVGAEAGELRDLRERMRAMLKEEGPPPQGRWADLALLDAVRDYPARHGSVMLVFDAVVEALDKAEAKANASR